MRRAIAITVAAVVGVAIAVAGFALRAGDGASDNAPSRPLWSEVHWPFPVDQWGKGKAFRCKAQDCGAEVNVYLRAKLGFCNCTSGVADDDDLDRMGDLNLIGKVSPLGAGRPVSIAWMKGRSRSYKLDTGTPSAKTVISIAFNERCDMIAATAVLGHDPAAAELSAIEFLNGSTMMRWAEITLGL